MEGQVTTGRLRVKKEVLEFRGLMIRPTSLISPRSKFVYGSLEKSLSRRNSVNSDIHDNVVRINGGCNICNRREIRQENITEKRINYGAFRSP